MQHPHHHRHRLTALLSVVGVHHVLALLGTIFFAALIGRNDPLLLTLSSRNRHLLLTVAGGVGALPYFLIATVRIAFPAVPYYLLGLHYGDRGLRWLEREAGGTPATIRWVERWFDRLGPALVVLMPASNLVALLAGARGLPARRFGVLVGVGIAVKLGFFWFLGKALEEPLQWLIDLIQRYQWWVVAAFFVLSVAQSMRNVRGTQEEHKPEEEDDLDVEAAAVTDPSEDAAPAAEPTPVVPPWPPPPLGEAGAG